MTRSYRFISEHRAVFGVTRLCKVLGVRRPGFYEWLAAAPTRTERAADDERLAAARSARSTRVTGAPTGVRGSSWLCVAAVVG